MINEKFLNLLTKNSIDFRDEEEISLKLLGSRKKLGILLFYQEDKRVVSFFNFGKTRILSKDFQSYEDLIKKIENLKKIEIEDKYLFFEAPICSKAKAYAQDIGWRVLHVSL